MKPSIDAHVQIFPRALDPVFERLSVGPLAHVRSRRWVDDTRQRLRRAGRRWLQPFAESLHRFQPITRIIPPPLRRALDRFGGWATLPAFLVEATPTDLDEVMGEALLTHAVVVAHPPLATNEFVLRESVINPRLIPVIALSPGTRNAAAALKRFVARGAKGIKIDPAADGEPADSGRYDPILRAAEELNLPVILPTGPVRLPWANTSALSRIETFVPWFELYPRLRFVIAHMNYHEPLAALDLADRYPNLFLETSWQPAEIVGEAVRRLGSSRVLFASDWPIGGRNIEVGLRRVKDCVEMGLINAAEAEEVLGLNAARLFGVSLKGE